MCSAPWRQRVWWALDWRQDLPGDMTWSITCAFVPERFLYHFIPLNHRGSRFTVWVFRIIRVPTRIEHELAVFCSPQISKTALLAKTHLFVHARDCLNHFLGVLYSQDPFIGSPNSAGPSRFISWNCYPFCLYRACFRCVYSFCPHLTRAEHFWGG